MISKIITIGQSGAGRAAVDAALDLDILCEWGTCGDPHGWEDHEQQGPDHAEQREKNVLVSQGTLIVSRGRLKGGPALTRELAEKHGRPCLHIDLEECSVFNAVSVIVRWIFNHNIDILNVEGPTADEDSRAYPDMVKLLKAVFFMDIGDLYRPHAHHLGGRKPGTVEEAVDALSAELSFKEKVMLSRMEEKELSCLSCRLGQYITRIYDLKSKGSALMNACRFRSGNHDLHEGEASALIIRELWAKLKKIYALRIIPFSQ